jgi:hypothetical protein
MGWVTTSSRRGLSSGGGIVLAVLTLALLPFTRSAPPWVWLAVLAVAMAGALGLRGLAARWRLPATILGAVALAVAVRALAPLWLACVAAVGALATAPLLAGFERRHPSRGLATGLFAISALGVYSTVPDTEEALVLAGVSTFVAVLAVAGLPLSLGAAGAGAAAAVYWWTVAAGGVGRAGSVVGAAGCLGVFLAEPVVVRLAAGWRRSSGGWRGSRTAWYTVQAIAALLCARVGGLRAGALEAALVVVPVLLGLVLVVLFLGRPKRLR